MIRRQKIVLDTNALISMMSKKLNFTNIFRALVNGEYELCISNDILFEYEEKIYQFFDDETVINTLKLFDILPNIHKVDIYYNLNLITADPGDNKFIDCAFACRALL